MRWAAPADDLPHVGAADEARTPSRRTVPEHDAGVFGHPQTLGGGGEVGPGGLAEGREHGSAPALSYVTGTLTVGDKGITNVNLTHSLPAP